ncbi:hypothetical protein ABFG93_21200 (plasmid) [Pseudalkalibacillus hwajinpoensis]|uniref:hypothetical protein n=1 Tax=Guptibacillus hwajinpoensis TaxID=208199 RepID=UPI00325BF018
MINWLKNNNYSTYYLFSLTFIVCIGTILFSVLTEVGEEEIDALKALINRDGPKAYALVGVIIAFGLLFTLIQLFFSSVLLHAVAKFIFRIPIQFKLFNRVFLIFILFLSLSVFWQNTLYYNNYEVFLIATNPLILVGMLVLFILLRGVVTINQVKPLLFTLFCYINYVIFTSITLGGI